MASCTARIWVVLGVMAAAVGLLWACTGDADPLQPDAAAPAVPASQRDVVVPESTASEATAASAVTSAPTVIASLAELRRGRSGGWVEDSGWAASGRFAGSEWLPLAAPAPLGPAQRDGARIGASPGDAEGALWQPGTALVSRIEDINTRVYDMCVLEDAVDRATRNGSWRLMPADAGRIHEYMDELDCDGDGVKGPLMYGYERGRYLAFGRDFDSRAEAEAYAERYVPQLRHSYSHTLPRATEPLGLNLCSGEYCRASSTRWMPTDWRAIEYASVTVPADEVRVMGGSLAVRDGALRGLVRNWSRNLWAYRVTVTVGDQSWHWPLSMQPGEAAPFEIDNWAGISDPLEADYTVTAQMSPDIDRSRQLDIGEYPDLTQDSFHQYLPQEIIDALPADTEALSHYDAYFVWVESHPSLSRLDPDRGEDEWGFELPPPEFEPRAFSAWIEHDGRVMDVLQTTPTNPATWDADGTYIPEPVIVEWAKPSPGGYLGFDIIRAYRHIWVGGANTAPALQ